MYLPGSSAVSTPLSQQTFKDTQCHLARIHWKWSHKPDDTGAWGPWRNQQFQKQRATVFFNPRSVLWTSIVVKWPRNCHEDRVQKNTFNRICGGLCAPSSPKLFFNNSLHPPFFGSVANSQNKFLSTLFFPHTYWYVWLNKCGLGRPSTRVFTQSQLEKNKVEKPQE